MQTGAGGVVHATPASHEGCAPASWTPELDEALELDELDEMLPLEVEELDVDPPELEVPELELHRPELELELGPELVPKAPELETVLSPELEVELDAPELELELSVRAVALLIVLRVFAAGEVVWPAPPTPLGPVGDGLDDAVDDEVAPPMPPLALVLPPQPVIAERAETLARAPTPTCLRKISERVAHGVRRGRRAFNGEPNPSRWSA